MSNLNKKHKQTRTKKMNRTQFRTTNNKNKLEQQTHQDQVKRTKKKNFKKLEIWVIRDRFLDASGGGEYFQFDICVIFGFMVNKSNFTFSIVEIFKGIETLKHTRESVKWGIGFQESLSLIIFQKYPLGSRAGYGPKSATHRSLIVN